LYDIKESDNQILIVIDVGGDFTVSTSLDGANIIFKGNKKLSHLKFSNGDWTSEWFGYEPKGALHTQSREHGEFLLTIQLPKGYEKVTLNNTKRTKVNGTFHVIVFKPDTINVVED